MPLHLTQQELSLKVLKPEGVRLPLLYIYFRIWQHDDNANNADHFILTSSFHGVFFFMRADWYEKALDETLAST